MASDEWYREHEPHRVENFSEGDTTCIRCGKTLHLWWNGGELDQKKCCGLIYRTEHVKVDLVVYDADPDFAPVDTSA